MRIKRTMNKPNYRLGKVETIVQANILAGVNLRSSKQNIEERTFKSSCSCDYECTCDKECRCDDYCACDTERRSCRCHSHCDCDTTCNCDQHCSCDTECSCDRDDSKTCDCHYDVCSDVYSNLN